MYIQLYILRKIIIITHLRRMISVGYMKLYLSYFLYIKIPNRLKAGHLILMLLFRYNN